MGELGGSHWFAEVETLVEHKEGGVEKEASTDGAGRAGEAGGQKGAEEPAGSGSAGGGGSGDGEGGGTTEQATAAAGEGGGEGEGGAGAAGNKAEGEVKVGQRSGDGGGALQCNLDARASPVDDCG